MGMEDMDTVADLPLAKVILSHSVALDPDFMFMIGQMTMATLAASELLLPASPSSLARNLQMAMDWK